MYRKHAFLCSVILVGGGGTREIYNEHSICNPYPALRLFIETAAINVIKTQLKKYFMCR
jgi:hypothetical protein